MAVIRIALAHPATSRKRPFFQVPMRRRELVKCSKRKHCERKLERQHDLAQCQEIGDAAVAAKSDHQDRGKNGEQAGDHPAQPGLDAPVHEAFHNDLAGEGSGDGAALSGGEKRDREHGAGDGRPEQRRESQVGNADPIAVGVELD